MNFENKLKEIATLREIKGKEKQALKLTDELEESAQKEKNHEVLVKLNWERALVWQHVAMSEATTDNPDQSVIKDAYEKMGIYSKMADEIITQNNLQNLKPPSYRFLGQYFRLTGDLPRAKDYYKKAIDMFEHAKSAQSLELKGFLAHVLIMMGQLEQGLELAKKTYEEYDTYEPALELRQKDYFTYAVWRSGIFLRIVDTLVKSGKPFDKDLVHKYLDLSENLLKKPDDVINWGDPNFSFRIDELNKAKKLLETVN